MTNKKKYIVGSIATAVAIVAIVVAALTSSTTRHNHPIASGKTSTSLPGSTTTSSSIAIDPVITSTTSKPQAKAVDPKPYAPRTPVTCSRPGEPSGAPFPGNDPNGSKQWVTVATISGACDGASKSFHLSGIDTRLAWRSDAPSFAAFLLDQNGLDSTGGYSDAECAGSCSDYQALVDGPGDFKLGVQADGGPWQLMIQEYR